MQSNNLIKIIVGAAVGLLVFVSFAMPMLIDSQESVADQDTKTNTGATYLSVAPNPTTISYDATNLKFTINSDEQVKVANALYIVSENFTLRTTSGSGTVFYLANTSTTESGISYNFTISYDGATLTLVKDSDSSTIVNVDATWLYVSTENGDYASAGYANNYYYTPDTNIIARGYYSTGELDTYYWVTPDGAGVSNTDYIISWAFEGTLQDDTLNLYLGKAVISISDGTDTETFTPFNYAIESEITYKEPSGTMYNLIGLLPLLLAVALVLGVIGYAIRARLS